MSSGKKVGGCRTLDDRVGGLADRAAARQRRGCAGRGR